MGLGLGCGDVRLDHAGGLRRHCLAAEGADALDAQRAADVVDRRLAQDGCYQGPEGGVIMDRDLKGVLLGT